MSLTVTHTEDYQAMFGDEPLSNVAASRSFASLVFEVLSGNTPTEAECKLFELILNLTIDHGPDTPSAKATIAHAESGEYMGVAVGAGIAEINGSHGGAQDALMVVLLRIHAGETTPEAVVAEHKALGARVPGYGHRIYTTDPRTTQIFEMLATYNMGADFRTSVEKIQKEIKAQLGKELPINVDSAIAVALLSFGWPPSLGSAIFIVARTVGLCGHYSNNKKKV